MIRESWFSNELIPIMQDYASKGAKTVKDFISMAMRDREKVIADYLADIGPREWRDLQRYFESKKTEKKKKISVTPGMARHMGRGNIKTNCSDCGMVIPKYTGGYPHSCPSCDSELNYGEDIDAVLDMSRAFVDNSVIITLLGVISEKAYVSFNNKVYAFSSKGCSIDLFVEDIEDCIGEDNCSIVTYLIKHASVETLDREIHTLAEKIVDNRIMQIINEEQTIKGFWESPEGKKILKEREKELENLQEQELKDLKMSINATLLEINKYELLDYLVDTTYDEEMMITTAQLSAESKREIIQKVQDSLSMKYQNTTLIQGEQEEEDYILLVY